ncbi:MAG: ferritin [Chloroflexota bacterium]
MFNEKIQKETNDQIQREIESAHIYLSMAAYFDSTTLPGFAQWMKAQFQEELFHAFKFYDFVNDRGGRVALQPIGQPPVEFTSPLDAFEKALAHEQKITSHINHLYALAIQEKDYATQQFLQWFIDEQVEEEKSVGEVVHTLKMIGDNAHALLMLDREMGQRQPPVVTGGGE